MIKSGTRMQKASFSHNSSSVTEAVQKATGPLLIELDKTPGAALGISLSHARHKGKHCVCIDSIRPMSVADR